MFSTNYFLRRGTTFVAIYLYILLLFFIYLFFLTTFAYLDDGALSKRGLNNSSTMVCPSVRGDYPRALASGLSPVQAEKPWYNYFTTLNSVDLAQYEIFHAKVCNFRQGWYERIYLLGN